MADVAIFLVIKFREIIKFDIARIFSFTNTGLKETWWVYIFENIEDIVKLSRYLSHWRRGKRKANPYIISYVSYIFNKNVLYIYFSWNPVMKHSSF